MFRYYITDVIEGQVKGTDDETVARDLATSEDFFVVDTKDGHWILSDGEKQVVGEFNA